MPTESDNNSVEGPKRRSTGLSGLDFQLGGGFPAGTTIVIYGNPLVGMDTMARQFWQAEETGSTYLMLDAVVEEEMTDCNGFSIEQLLGSMKGERVVVDSLSTIIKDQGIDAAITLMTEGAKPVIEKEGNVLFILYKGVHDHADELRVIRSADVFLTLYEELHGNEIERKLIFHKLRYLDVPSRAFPYNIMDYGLELSTTARVV